MDKKSVGIIVINSKIHLDEEGNVDISIWDSHYKDPTLTHYKCKEKLDPNLASLSLAMNKTGVCRLIKMIRKNKVSWSMEDVWALNSAEKEITSTYVDKWDELHKDKYKFI